jgi:hypothetical protein
LYEWVELRTSKAIEKTSLRYDRDKTTKVNRISRKPRLDESKRYKKIWIRIRMFDGVEERELCQGLR